MLRKTLIAGAALAALTAAVPASATYTSSTSGWHTHNCACGHIKCDQNTTTTSTSSGTQVPEPGMLGLAGLGLMGLGVMRLRRRKHVKA